MVLLSELNYRTFNERLLTNDLVLNGVLQLHVQSYARARTCSAILCLVYWAAQKGIALFDLMYRKKYKSCYTEIRFTMANLDFDLLRSCFDVILSEISIFQIELMFWKCQ